MHDNKIKIYPIAIIMIVLVVFCIALDCAKNPVSVEVHDFIEKECSPGHVEWYGEFAHKVEVNGVVENVMDEMLELYHWWNTVYLKEYPKMMDDFWAVAEKCGPEMKCEPYEDMPDCVASQLVTIYKDDEQRDAYKRVIKEITDVDALMDEKCEEMLKRLAAIRLWMWT